MQFNRFDVPQSSDEFNAPKTGCDRIDITEEPADTAAPALTTGAGSGAPKSKYIVIPSESYGHFEGPF